MGSWGAGQERWDHHTARCSWHRQAACIRGRGKAPVPSMPAQEQGPGKPPAHSHTHLHEVEAGQQCHAVLGGSALLLGGDHGPGADTGVLPCLAGSSVTPGPHAHGWAHPTAPLQPVPGAAPPRTPQGQEPSSLPLQHPGRGCPAQPGAVTTGGVEARLSRQAAAAQGVGRGCAPRRAQAWVGVPRHPPRAPAARNCPLREKRGDREEDKEDGARRGAATRRTIPGAAGREALTEGCPRGGKDGGGTA